MPKLVYPNTKVLTVIYRSNGTRDALITYKNTDELYTYYADISDRRLRALRRQMGVTRD